MLANLKRYRAAVLKAACEGRLVPTEAELARKERRSFEPADVLLRRILVERRSRWEGEQLAKMTAKGQTPRDDRWKAKYEEPGPPDSTAVGKAPDGWVWARVDQCFRVFVGATPSRAREDYWSGDIPWVSSGEVAFCRIRTTRESITKLGLDCTSTQIHPVGTVLLGMIGEGKTRGQAAILDIPACNNQNSAAIRVADTRIEPEFVYRFFEKSYAETRSIGGGNNQQALNRSRVEALQLPLPPLAEQRRIIAEVDRLLSVAEQTERTVRAQLARAARLRQSVLKRAFEGKLVPQDPRDEPASALLERIRAASATERVAPRRRGATGRATKREPT